AEVASLAAFSWRAPPGGHYRPTIELQADERCFPSFRRGSAERTRERLAARRRRCEGEPAIECGRVRTCRDARAHVVGHCKAARREHLEDGRRTPSRLATGFASRPYPAVAEARRLRIVEERRDRH